MPHHQPLVAPSRPTQRVNRTSHADTHNGHGRSRMHDQQPHQLIIAATHALDWNSRRTRAHTTFTRHNSTAHTGNSPPSARQHVQARARARALAREQGPPSTYTNRDHVTSPVACRSTARAVTQRPRATSVQVRSLTTSGAGTGPAAARCITNSDDCHTVVVAALHHSTIVPCGAAPRW
jgi:hypothetical protein